MPLSPLPIDAVLPELTAALQRSPAVVLRAPTGAGKTTRVPPALLDAGLAGDGQIVVLEPRRLAARAAARRIALERAVKLGAEVGYHVRFDKQAGRATRILTVTPGILLRKLLDDPFLESASVIVFDEFHERSLENDLALGLVRLLQQTVRPELRLVVMSATLAVEKAAEYLGGCPVVVSEGRLHPVEIVQRSAGVGAPDEWVAMAVEEMLDRTPGDILVFLPGMALIRSSAEQLGRVARERDLAVLPLHGDLSPEEQDRALQGQSRRRVVLATNVAETSVTVEGITAVVDLGWAQQLSLDPDLGLDRLQMVEIAKDAADQRAGRAGRLAPGLCLRLWSEANHRQRPERTEPEVRRIDLAGAVLQLLALGEKDVLSFPWLDAPSPAAVEQALGLLRKLGAVQGTELTDLGRMLARLPVHPRLGRLLVEGQRLGIAARAALGAALLSERDPFTRSIIYTAPPRPEYAGASDLVERVEVVGEFERRGRTETPLGTLHRGLTEAVLRTRDHLLRLLLEEGGGAFSPLSLYSGRGGGGEGRRILDETCAVREEEPPLTPNPSPRVRGEGSKQDDPDDLLRRALVPAYPDRLARRREPGSRKGLMVGGRGVEIARGSCVTEGELFLCLDVDGKRAEALVRRASVVQRDWLPPELLTSVIEVEFDPATEKVIARKRTRYDDLLLEETHAALPDEAEVARVLVHAAARQLERVLPPADSPAGQYLTRLRCLRGWWPELGLPDFAEGDLAELLTWICHRCRSFEDLRGADWLGAFQGKLSHEQRQIVEREAPERLEVPSGSRIALQYEVNRPPVLAVRIQELFGWAETPRLAGGRVKVLLHLLAPNYRPQQVTDDLASFWHNTYAVVRKELRARYPKHAWPEDPWAASRTTSRDR